MALNSETVVIASADSFFVWRYTVPRRSAIETAAVAAVAAAAANNKTAAASASPTLQHIDDYKTARSSDGSESGTPKRATRSATAGDGICAACVGNDCILLVCGLQ